MRVKKIDELDLVILKKLFQYSGTSIVELGTAINRSVASVHDRLSKLEDYGYIEQIPGLARSRKVTNSGEAFLRANDDRK